MPKYAALLRGINVGRNKRVAMEDLRKILGRLGHVDVKTYLNSGNVVFTSRSENPRGVASEIEEALRALMAIKRQSPQFPQAWAAFVRLRKIHHAATLLAERG